MQQGHFEENLTLPVEPGEDVLHQLWPEFFVEEIQRKNHIADGERTPHVAVMAVSILARVSPGRQGEQLFQVRAGARKRRRIAPQPGSLRSAAATR